MKPSMWPGGLVLLVLSLLISAARGADGAPPTKNQAFLRSVPKAVASFEPATARPGQTVTWKLALELAPGWHTYPTRQTDPKAEQQTTRITFPEAGDVTFTGEVKDPPYKSKPELEAEILDLHYLEDSPVVWERTAVVSPSAKPGLTSAKVRVKMQVCDASKCLPPETLVFDTPLTVAEGGPVATDPGQVGAQQPAGAAAPPSASPGEPGGAPGPGGNQPPSAENPEGP